MLQEKPPMQDYYAARAGEYDQVYEKPERQSDLRQIERWLPGVLAGRTVLEIACGTGYWTQFIAPHCPHIVAVDSAPQTLEIARSRVPEGKVSFVVGDAYQLPPQARPLGAGFAGFWWSHIPRARIAAFLRGFHALLEPGAPVVFLDNRFVSGSSTPISERDAEGNTFQTRTLANGSSHRVLKNFPTPAELAAALADFAVELRHHQWQYYWAIEYRVRGL
jgi:ubiquinone/menaquinone biosynthesis C-methylase UbiE